MSFISAKYSLLFGIVISLIGGTFLSVSNVEAQSPDADIQELVALIKISRSSTTRAPIQDISLSQGVEFSDLDLSTRSGLIELRMRIEETAQNLCHEIDRRYPTVDDTIGMCVSRTVASAMAQVRRLRASYE